MSLQNIKKGDYVALVYKSLLGGCSIEKVLVTKASKNCIHIGDLKFYRSSGCRERKRGERHAPSGQIEPWSEKVEKEIVEQELLAKKSVFIDIINSYDMQNLPLEILQKIVEMISSASSQKDKK